MDACNINNNDDIVWDLNTLIANNEIIKGRSEFICHLHDFLNLSIYKHFNYSLVCLLQNLEWVGAPASELLKGIFF